MEFYSIILIAFGSFFLLAWAFIGWLKFREHHHILHDEHHRHKTHITYLGRIRPWKNPRIK